MVRPRDVHVRPCLRALSGRAATLGTALVLGALHDYCERADRRRGPPCPPPRRDPIYRKTYIELDRADERLKFYTIDESKLLPEQRVGLPLSDSCRPLFVVYKDKVPINKVLGVNAPELELVIADNVPPVPRDEE